VVSCRHPPDASENNLLQRTRKTKPKPKEREPGREEVFPYHLASGKWNKSQKEHKQEEEEEDPARRRAAKSRHGHHARLRPLLILMHTRA
jgi:hypothetical protein